MVFTEMVTGKINATIYDKCFFNANGKTRPQIAKYHLALMSVTTSQRYDVFIFESSILDFDKVNVPESNGKKLFELTKELYDSVNKTFYFYEVVSNGATMTPNFAFEKYDECGKYVMGFTKDTRQLDVMFKKITPDEAKGMQPQQAKPIKSNEDNSQSQQRPAETQSQQTPAESVQRPAPSQSQQRPAETQSQQRPAESVQRPASSQSQQHPAETQSQQRPAESVQRPAESLPILVYDRFCMDYSTKQKKEFVKFAYNFISPATNQTYNAIILQSSHKKYDDIQIPQKDGKPVVAIQKDTYEKFTADTFFFIEVSSSGQIQAPNVRFETLDSAKKYLFNYTLDTRPLDVMFKKLTKEDAEKLGKQPTVKAGDTSASETDKTVVSEHDSEKVAASQQQTAATTEKENITSEQNNAANEKTAASAVDENKDTVAKEDQKHSGAEQVDNKTDTAQNAKKEAVSETGQSRKIVAVTPPVSMAIYSRFCTKAVGPNKAEFIKHKTALKVEDCDRIYKLIAVCSSHKSFEEIVVPESNGKKLFELSKEDYEKLTKFDFYYIEVAHSEKSNAINKIFKDLESCIAYMDMYHSDIRELEVMFRNLTPKEAGERGAIKAVDSNISNASQKSVSTEQEQVKNTEQTEEQEVKQAGTETDNQAEELVAKEAEEKADAEKQAREQAEKEAKELAAKEAEEKAAAEKQAREQAEKEAEELAAKEAEEKAAAEKQTQEQAEKEAEELAAKEAEEKAASEQLAKEQAEKTAKDNSESSYATDIAKEEQEAAAIEAEEQLARQAAEREAEEKEVEEQAAAQMEATEIAAVEQAALDRKIAEKEVEARDIEEKVASRKLKEAEEEAEIIDAEAKVAKEKASRFKDTRERIVLEKEAAEKSSRAKAAKDRAVKERITKERASREKEIARKRALSNAAIEREATERVAIAREARIRASSEKEAAIRRAVARIAAEKEAARKQAAARAIYEKLVAEKNARDKQRAVESRKLKAELEKEKIELETIKRLKEEKRKEYREELSSYKKALEVEKEKVNKVRYTTRTDSEMYRQEGRSEIPSVKKSLDDASHVKVTTYPNNLASAPTTIHADNLVIKVDKKEDFDFGFANTGLSRSSNKSTNFIAEDEMLFEELLKSFSSQDYDFDFTASSESASDEYYSLSSFEDDFGLGINFSREDEYYMATGIGDIDFDNFTMSDDDFNSLIGL